MLNVLKRIQKSPLVFDGAMGTMLYSKGVFINTCYDELNLTNPKLIRSIHHDYVEAGADVIETNTFGANRIKLSRYGLADKTVAINRAAVELARAEAGESVSVAASVGPCLAPGQFLTETLIQELEAAYEEQIGALTEAGVDAVVFETFSNPDELRLAARVARRFGAPVFGCMTMNERAETALGSSAEEIIALLDTDENLDGLGINCGTGPTQACETLAHVIHLTRKPFLVMPNAGLPREVDGRTMYLANPEYFTEYAKRFVELGARGVGGCCGTTPEHIRMVVRAVKGLSGVKRHIEVKAYRADEVTVPATPLSEKSRFAGKLARGEKVCTVEILPPRSCDLAVMLQKARTCHVQGADAINIPDGPRASSRVSPMIAALAIKNQIGIEPILHYCCRDRNLIGMQADLIGGFAAGLANFLIITGDPPKLGDYPDATGVFDVDAIGLTQVANNLNHGRDAGGGTFNPPTSILIGVGANPCALDLDREVERYFRKIDAGAEYAITQPIFDPEALFRFLDRVGQYSTTIPVVAGVWPLTSFKNAEFMKNEVPGVEVPDRVLERMSTCKTREEGRQEGIAIAREICEQIASSVAGFQVSAPFGQVDIALEVLRGLPTR
jgi:homocysteine S-methyltransferase